MELDDGAINAMNNKDCFVPEHFREQIIAYIEVGNTPGSFIYCVICNDLQGAIRNASRTGLYLETIARWFWNYAPMQCHGSEDKYRGWIDARRRDIAREQESAA